MALVEDHVKPSPPLSAEILDDRPIWEIIVESGPENPRKNGPPPPMTVAATIRIETD